MKKLIRVFGFDNRTKVTVNNLDKYQGNYHSRKNHGQYNSHDNNVYGTK